LEDFDPELREMIGADEMTPLELSTMQMYAHRPSIAKAFVGLFGALSVDTTLPPRLLELVRLRIAFFNQCRSCMAIRFSSAIDDGLTEDLVCSLERPHEADDLSPAEQAAIRYGELLATDHLSIDDSVYEELREHFSEEQIIELGAFAAFAVGFGRLLSAWKLVEELPDRFKEEGEVLTPWGGESVTVG
jgi:alkylhydroperoxidase family enzyme